MKRFQSFHIYAFSISPLILRCRGPPFSVSIQPKTKIETEEINVKIINLREYYQEIFKEDRFIEVTDEVAALFADDKRQQKNYSQYIRDNKAIYSLDCGDGIEKDSLYPPEKPTLRFRLYQRYRRGAYTSISFSGKIKRRSPEMKM